MRFPFLTVLIRAAIIAILVFAIVNKMWNKTAILHENSMMANPFLYYASIGLEGFVVAIVIVAPKPLAWLTSISTFLFFLPIASYSWVTHSNCGCFGNKQLDWLSTPVDLVIVSLLWLTRTRWSNPIPKTDGDGILTRRSFVSACFGILMGAISIGLASFPSPQGVRNRKIQFLFADELKGEKFPILQLEWAGNGKLSVGNWLVIIVRKDCEHCRRLHSEIGPLIDTEHPFHVVTFVAGSDEWGCQFGRLDLDNSFDDFLRFENGEPFVASPAAFLLQDSIVIDAAEGDSTHQLLRRLLSVN